MVDFMEQGKSTVTSTSIVWRLHPTNRQLAPRGLRPLYLQNNCLRIYCTRLHRSKSREWVKTCLFLKCFKHLYWEYGFGFWFACVECQYIRAWIGWILDTVFGCNRKLSNFFELFQLIGHKIWCKPSFVLVWTSTS